MHLKISSAEWRLFCPGGDDMELIPRHLHDATHHGSFNYIKETIYEEGHYQLIQQRYFGIFIVYHIHLCFISVVQIA